MYIDSATVYHYTEEEGHATFDTAIYNGLFQTRLVISSGGGGRGQLGLQFRRLLVVVDTDSQNDSLSMDGVVFVLLLFIFCSGH